MKRTAIALSAALTAACGGGGTSPGSPSSSVSPQVAGQYTVAVRLLDNGCGAAPTVQPQPTSVEQTPGAPAFSLTHGGLRVTGAVERDGAFTTQPLGVTDPLGPAVVTLGGRFTTSGLEAIVTVDVSPPAPAAACRYRVEWSGTKQGPPNVLG
jgi:hypothetical protein